jgi:hypothetical protein
MKDYAMKRLGLVWGVLILVGACVDNEEPGDGGGGMSGGGHAGLPANGGRAGGGMAGGAANGGHSGSAGTFGGETTGVAGAAGADAAGASAVGGAGAEVGGAGGELGSGAAPPSGAGGAAGMAGASAGSGGAGGSVETFGAALCSSAFGSGAVGFAVAFDPLGNIVVAGSLTGPLDIGADSLVSAGGTDLFVAKLDANCQPIWAKRFGTSGTQAGGLVTLDPAGNIYVAVNSNGKIDFGGGAPAGGADRNIALAKLKPNGDYVWSKDFGDSQDQVINDLRSDANGHIVMGGNFTGTVNFGGQDLTGAAQGGGSDVYLAALDSDGNHVFSEMFPAGAGPHDHQVRGLAVAPDGSITATGVFNGALDLGDGMVDVANAYHLFIAHYSASGAFKWKFVVKGSDHAAACDEAGNSIVALDTNFNNVDFGNGVKPFGPSLVKLGPTGNALWSRPIGKLEPTNHGLATDADGNIALSGDLYGATDLGGGTLTPAGTDDIALALFDADGNHRFSEKFGDNKNQSWASVTMSPGGTIYMTGAFAGRVDFGNGPLDAAVGLSSLFVMKR